MTKPKVKCPKCGSGVEHTHEKDGHIIVLFKCMFCATFDRGLSDEEMQRRLDDFEESGAFDKWLTGLDAAPSFFG